MNILKPSRLYRSPLIIFMIFLGSLELKAYPEFIGLGYTGCATCHFNGAGNGALNDYGRGLFAVEVAARPFWNLKQSDESLSEQSGFLGSKQLPYWIRPSIKTRTLSVEKNPGSKDQKTKKYYVMQQDLNLHLPFNPDQTFLFALNMGTVASETAAAPSKAFNKNEEPLFMTREYYLRGQFFESFFVYAGYMDKVFGIRHADHTSINRTALDLGQNDQVHGAVFHYAGEKNEFFLNPFAGNLQLEKEKQFPGFTMHYEFEPAEQWRVGLSYLRDKDETLIERNTLAFVFKRGINGGHSLLAEAGYRNGLNAKQVASTSAYFWSQASIRLYRGVFWQSLLEYYKADITKLAQENLRWGMGFLIFPFQRLEIRFGAQTARVVDPTQVSKDVWALQSQMHFSF